MTLQTLAVEWNSCQRSSLKMDILQIGVKIVYFVYCLSLPHSYGYHILISLSSISAVVNPTLWPGSLHPRQSKIHLHKGTFAKACVKGWHESKARSRDRLAHTAWPVSSWTSIETDWFNALHLPNCHSSQRGFGWRQGKHCKNEFAH